MFGFGLRWAEALALNDVEMEFLLGQAERIAARGDEE